MDQQEPTTKKFSVDLLLEYLRDFSLKILNGYKDKWPNAAVKIWTEKAHRDIWGAFDPQWYDNDVRSIFINLDVIHSFSIAIYSSGNIYLQERLIDNLYRDGSVSVIKDTIETKINAISQRRRS